MVNIRRTILLLSVFLMGHTVVTPEYKLTALAKPNSLRRGESGKVIISIELSRKAYIKPAPPLIIKCPQVEGVILPKEIFKSSEMNLPILQKKELSYIDIREGIEIPFTIEEKAKSGKRELSFELKFLICSESKGICAKAVEVVKVEIFVKRRAIKK